MITIRNATIKDALNISRFVTDLSRRHIGPTLTDGAIEFLVASMDEPSTLTRILDGWPTFCALDKQDLCGVAVVKPPHHLYHLFVRSDLQRQGVGKSLFLWADKNTREQTGHGITTVNASLNAIAVYERLGFVVSGPVQDLHGVRYQPMMRQE